MTGDTAQLEQLLRQAFDDLPGPDPARLSDIEARLRGRLQRRRPWLWWWLPLLLVTGAAAAWWGMHTLTATAPDTVSIKPGTQQKQSAPPETAPLSPEQPSDAQAASPEDQSSVIYQREVY
jgi:hypothetical protein